MANIYIKKSSFVHVEKIPKRFQSIANGYYVKQKESLGYVKYKIRYDKSMQAYHVDVYTKPAYYPSENVTSVLTVHPLTQKLIRTTQNYLSEADLIGWMQATCGKSN